MDVVSMPQLGETVTEGTITVWRKAVGDRVEVDDALFDVSTEKVDTEVPAANPGYLRVILVAEGSTVSIGTPLAVLTDTADEPFELPTGDGIGGPGDRRRHVDAGGSSGTVGGADGVRGDSTVRGLSRFLSPAVKRLMTEHRLDPAEVAGSGRDGRITRADVLAAVAQRERQAVIRPAPAGRIEHAGQPDLAEPTEPVEVGERDEVVELSRARLATAEHMRRSLDTAAHAHVSVTVDYGRVDVVRRAAGLRRMPFVARAVIDALREFPHLNAVLDGERLILRRSVHLGIAVDLDGEALVVPVLRDADGLTLRAIAVGVADLAERARRRRLPGDAFGGGTFTLTNVGAFGTMTAAPIINLGQVAILSIDGIAMTPVAVPTGPSRSTGATEGPWAVAVRPVGNLSLSFDHRAVDGAYAAAFLARVRDLIENRDWFAEAGDPTAAEPVEAVDAAGDRPALERGDGQR